MTQKTPTDADLKRMGFTAMRPMAGIVPLDLRELWEYRELAVFMLWRNIKGRYRQMAFGPLWIVMAPLLNMVLFTIIFGRIAKLPSDDIPHPLFIYSALLPWTFFSGSLFTSAGSLLSSRELIAKVYFPRLLIPLIGVLSSLVDFLVSFLILVGMMWFYGYTLTLGVLYLPLFLLLAAMTGLAVGLWCAPWIVHFRDVNTILSYVVRVWMYASPVVYASSLVPARLRFVYRMNPMTNMIEGFRWALLGTDPPPVKMIVLSFAVITPLLLAGAFYFRRQERNIVDIA